MATTPRIDVSPATRRGMFALTPDLGAGFAELYGTFWRNGVLEQEVKEVVRIRNARLTDCGY